MELFLLLFKFFFCSLSFLMPIFTQNYTCEIEVPENSQICNFSVTILLCLHVIVMSRTSFRANPHSIVCLNVKKLLARTRCHIWSLSKSKGIRTHNHLVRKWTFNHLAELAKWLNVRLQTKWLWLRIPLLSLCLVFVLNIWEGPWSCKKCQNIKVWRKLEWVTSKCLFL